MSNPSAFGGRGFWDALAGRSARGPVDAAGASAPTYASVTDHMLTLGALIAAGADDGGRVSDFAQRAADPAMHADAAAAIAPVPLGFGRRHRTRLLPGPSWAHGPGGCFSNVVR